MDNVLSILPYGRMPARACPSNDDARWQLLGAIAAAEQPQPVVQLARSMGVTRQAVQRIANDLEREGCVAFLPNPDHKRSQLVVLTEPGRALFEKALVLQKPWAAELARDLQDSQIKAACDVLDIVLEHLDDRRKSR